MLPTPTPSFPLAPCPLPLVKGSGEEIVFNCLEKVIKGTFGQIFGRSTPFLKYLRPWLIASSETWLGRFFPKSPSRFSINNFWFFYEDATLRTNSSECATGRRSSFVFCAVTRKSSVLNFPQVCVCVYIYFLLFFLFSLMFELYLFDTCLTRMKNAVVLVWKREKKFFFAFTEVHWNEEFEGKKKEKKEKHFLSKRKVQKKYLKSVIKWFKELIQCFFQDFFFFFASSSFSSASLKQESSSFGKPTLAG